MMCNVFEGRPALKCVTYLFICVHCSEPNRDKGLINKSDKIPPKMKVQFLARRYHKVSSLYLVLKCDR